jgi:hypothetical protein
MAEMPKAPAGRPVEREIIGVPNTPIPTLASQGIDKNLELSPLD